MSEPLHELTLDFETYYSKKEKYSLASKGMTYEKYIRDQRFEVIGLAVKWGEGDTMFLAPHEIETWAKGVDHQWGWDNIRVIAQNGRFDAAILGWRYGIYPKQIADTMLMSRACQIWDGNSLDIITRELRERYEWGLFKVAGGTLTCGYKKDVVADFGDSIVALDKGTEVHDADGKHLADFTDEEYDAYAEYCKLDVDLTYSAYKWFVQERKFPEMEIDVMTATIETFTFPILELDTKLLEELDAKINGERQALLDKVGITLEEVRSDAKFAEALRRLGVAPPTKVTSTGATKFAFAKKDLEFLALLEHEDKAVVELVEARLGNKSSQAVTRVKSFYELSLRGATPIPIEYYGAHTGRWAGSDGLNFQNINRNQLVDKSTPKGTLVFYNNRADRVVSILDDGRVHLARAGVVENNEEELHIAGLRDCLKAPKGYTLCVLDWSQIELRANSWLWGEQWILDALTSGKDIYKVTASQTYGIPYDEVSKSQRFVGKSQQLGLGYGAGVNGLKVVMGKRSEEFTDDELQSFVNAYRLNSPNIKKGWGKFKNAFAAMVQGMDIDVGDANGLLKVRGQRILRPNGMNLTYRKMHQRDGDTGMKEFWFWGKDKTTKKPNWERTFGGKGDENGCQALCRDIAAEKVVDIRKKFFRQGLTRYDAHIVMTVHDEIITCCKTELADEVMAIMREEMERAKGWYATLPLACDGSVATRYGCAK